MSKEGMFIVVLTINKLDGRLLTSPDIISRGFIYLRDSEELMNDIRQYLKQKVARSFGNRKSELEVIKKEIKDEVTQILYDRTKRTPIVIPVVNEVTVSTNKKVNAKTESKVEETLAKMPPLRPARISAKDLASDDADDRYTY